MPIKKKVSRVRKIHINYSLFTIHYSPFTKTTKGRPVGRPLSLDPGSCLSSHAVSSTVLSVYVGLTSVFGMRTGGSPQLNHRKSFNTGKNISIDSMFFLHKMLRSTAVACLAEAKKLRKLTQKNILILNWIPKAGIKWCAQNNVSITVFDKKHIEILTKVKTKQKIKIHFAINTGMNRIGFCCEQDFLQAVRSVSLCKHILIEGIFTHFYNAENLIDTEKQNCIFNHFINLLAGVVDIKKVICHAESSNAYFLHKHCYDMARVGILLYGLLQNKGGEFREVLSITSKVVCITKIKKGQSVGYGKNYVAKKDMTVATVPLGYADGIMRSVSKNGKVLCGRKFCKIVGKFCKIVGNVCMDMFMIDVSKTDVKLFDKVVLIGKDKTGKNISTNQFAKWCGTIGYEILTNIKKDRFVIKVKK